LDFTSDDGWRRKHHLFATIDTIIIIIVIIVIISIPLAFFTATEKESDSEK